MNFIRHDVENLEPIISRNTIDYVVDIESSAFYPNKGAFYRQVSNILRRDGVFLYGTMMFAFQMNAFERRLEQYFDIEKKEEITTECLRSLKLGTPQTRDWIENNFPWCKLF